MNTPNSESAVDVSNMTKAQLLEYANINDIQGVSSSMNKAEIYSKIKEWQTGNA